MKAKVIIAYQYAIVLPSLKKLTLKKGDIIELDEKDSVVLEILEKEGFVKICRNENE